ncbi:MAG: ribonuclease HII [Desulfobacterales bacterium]|nr:ribonuclease HII [Desulfobacterales bacterium]
MKGMEEEILKKGKYDFIIGVDEAGRGPIAGPLVVAACHIPVDIIINGMNDSKKLSKANRERIFQKMSINPRVIWKVSIISNKIIDQTNNILQTTLKGMRECTNLLLKATQQKNALILVDGNTNPNFQSAVHCKTIIKGDSKVYCIAGASIVAKVIRDQMTQTDNDLSLIKRKKHTQTSTNTRVIHISLCQVMIRAAKLWPSYSFEKNKGYPTKEHKDLLTKHGPCVIHRKSFSPIKQHFKSDENC